MPDLDPKTPAKPSNLKRIITLAGILLAILAIFYLVTRPASAEPRTFSTTIR